MDVDRSNYSTDILTAHLDAHISATRHYFTGAPDPPEPPYAPSYHPPTGYWTAAEKSLFFHALSTHSRFRPDLIASSIGTKSQLDVIIYLDLLHSGAQDLTAVRGAIARDQLPAAYEVSDALVNLEDTHAASLAASEPSRTDESCAAARAEAQRAMRNSMRVVRKGEGAVQVRDRAGQQVRREVFGRWRAEQEGVWAREDLLARLDGIALQAFDRMLRVDEEPVQPQPSRTTNHEDEDVDALANLSPVSRRRAYKRLYMRRKRAEARGDVAQLDPARLKPGRKATTAQSQRRPSADDSTDDDDDEAQTDDAEQKRRLHGPTRPYRVQRKLDELGIDAEYMRANGLGLFRLGALWRLMRCVSCTRKSTLSLQPHRLYPRFDPSKPQGVTEFISAGTIQALHTLVVRFTRDIVRRALTLRELDFARRGQVKMWRLGKREVRPPHVRRALQTRGACLGKQVHFDALLARFDESEGEDSESEEEVPLAVLMQRRSDEDEDRDWTDDEEDADVDKHLRPHSRHREPYVPFVHAPDLVAPSHPFGIYAPGTIPEPLGTPIISQGVRRPYDEEDLMTDQTDEEALNVELAGETLLDAVDARAAVAYEAGVWRDLSGAVRTRTRRRKREVEEDHGRMRTRKRRKVVVRSALEDALKSPDGVKVKSAAMIEDEDEE